MTPIDFSGRVAIVTGAGNGLGKDCALALAARGARVVVNDVGADPDGTGGSSVFADAVVSRIREAGGEAIANHDSVASRAGGNAIVETAMDHFGRVDIVINNAGNQRNNRFEDMTDDEFDAVINVHLNGAFYVSQPAYRVMMQQGFGRFVFTSSASGVFGHFIRTNYASAKAGVIGMMHSVALEGERYGILANALLPAAASRLGKAPDGMMHPDWDAQDATRVPGTELIGARMRPDYVTPLSLYLASEQCASTHAIWSAVGGRYARVFIGASRGWMAPGDHPPAPEDIAANLQQIESRSPFREPLTVAEEIAHVVEDVSRRSD